MKMKIFLISIDEWDYDCYSDMVIVANNTDECKKLAKENSAAEGKEIWETAIIREQGNYTGKNQEPFILLSSYHAG